MGVGSKRESVTTVWLRACVDFHIFWGIQRVFLALIKRRRTVDWAVLVFSLHNKNVATPMEYV
jgi:hypothetical protein